LISVDGKISTGDTDVMDVDSDYKKISGVKEGLSQYYDIEKTTDLYFLITGRVMTKECEQLNVNNRKDEPFKLPANCVIVDETHLKESGVEYLLKKFNSLTIVTANEFHSANNVKSENLKIINYKDKIDFSDLFEKLKNDYGIEAITIQSGGTLNTELIRAGLVDYLSLVIAPAMIGGKNTSTLMDGESLHTQDELYKIKPLKLELIKELKDSYIYLKYKVLN
ncbi:MAG: dihydrofolate reductase family protein, partial [Patescibacteria group bacterium]